MDARTAGTPTSEINVTPLVDVMLVVLIIFMLVTPLLQQGMGVALPEARNVMNVADEGDDVVTIAIRADGGIFLGTDPVEPGRLGQVLAREFDRDPARPFQIKADRTVRFGRVKDVIRLGRQAGFAGAELIAEERVADDEPEGS